jgi:hypothetical protein
MGQLYRIEATDSSDTELNWHQGRLDVEMEFSRPSLSLLKVQGHGDKRREKGNYKDRDRLR